MAAEDPVAERLRAFVRARVRRGGAHYTWGDASRLARHLQIDSGWVTEYTDDPPTRHADIDTALAICAFYGVSLEDFMRRTPPSPPPAATLTPEQAQLARIAELWPGLRETFREIVLDMIEREYAVAHGRAKRRKSPGAAAPDQPAVTRSATARRRGQR